MATEFIDAYNAGTASGLALKKQREDHEENKRRHLQEEEDRKLRIDLLQQAAKMHKLEGQLKARQLVIDEQKRLEAEGQAGISLQVPAAVDEESGLNLGAQDITTRSPGQLAQLKQQMTAAEGMGKQQQIHPAVAAFLKSQGVDVAGMGAIDPNQLTGLVSGVGAAAGREAAGARADAAAARSAAGTLTPVVGPDGTVTASFNNRTGQVTPVANPTGARKTPVSDAARKDQADLQSLHATLDSVTKLLDDPEVKGANGGAGATGLLQQHFTTAQVKSGLAGPKLNELYTQLGRLEQFLYNVSGKQINEAELPRLLKAIPNLGAPEGQIRSQIKSFKSQLEAAQSRFKKEGPAAPAAGVANKRLVFDPATGELR